MKYLWCLGDSSRRFSAKITLIYQAHRTLENEQTPGTRLWQSWWNPIFPLLACNDWCAFVRRGQQRAVCGVQLHRVRAGVRRFWSSVPLRRAWAAQSAARTCDEDCSCACDVCGVGCHNVARDRRRSQARRAAPRPRPRVAAPAHSDAHTETVAAALHTVSVVAPAPQVACASCGGPGPRAYGPLHVVLASHRQVDQDPQVRQPLWCCRHGCLYSHCSVVLPSRPQIKLQTVLQPPYHHDVGSRGIALLPRQAWNPVLYRNEYCCDHHANVI